MSTTNGLNGVHNVKHKDGEQNEYMHDLEETIKKLHNATNFNRVASKVTFFDTENKNGSTPLGEAADQV